MKKSLVSFLAVIYVLTAYGQNAKKEKEPEAEVGTLEAAWKPVVMDHVFSLRGGYGMGSARLEPRRNGISYNGLINYGISYRLDAPEQLYVGCLEFDLEFMEKGFQYETSFESGDVYSRKYQIIQFPILWQPYLPLSTKNTANRFYLNAGPYLGYAIGSSYRKYRKEGDVTLEEGSYVYNSVRDNYLEYGLVVGAGLQFSVKRIVFGFDFRYNIMLSDIMKTPQKYPSNTFSRTPVDHLNFSLSLGYKINRNKKANKAE